MPVELPEEATLTCDGCGEEETVTMTHYAGDPPTVGVDDTDITTAGWSRDGDEVYCADCTAERDEEE